MVDEGKIIPLDDYMTEENTPNLLSIADSNPFLSGGLYNGIQYGIPVVNPSQGEGKAMYAVGSYLDSVDYESKDIYTYEDMLSCTILPAKVPRSLIIRKEWMVPIQRTIIFSACTVISAT